MLGSVGKNSQDGEGGSGVVVVGRGWEGDLSPPVGTD